MQGTFAGDGDSAVFKMQYAQKKSAQSDTLLNVRALGTWDGATVSLKERGEDGSYRVVQDGAFTANACRTFAAIRGREYKLTASSSGASTSVYYELAQNGV